ncbi:hypothetical protein ACWC0C_19740 [Streptomyces sp. NPDC001709]
MAAGDVAAGDLRQGVDVGDPADSDGVQGLAHAIDVAGAFAFGPELGDQAASRPMIRATSALVPSSVDQFLSEARGIKEVNVSPYRNILSRSSNGDKEEDVSTQTDETMSGAHVPYVAATSKGFSPAVLLRSEQREKENEGRARCLKSRCRTFPVAL